MYCMLFFIFVNIIKVGDSFDVENDFGYVLVVIFDFKEKNWGR